MADLFDALNANTRATGNWAKGKAPSFPQWPRPDTGPRTPAEKRPVSVAQVYQQFQRR